MQFTEWLVTELERRGWSRSETARRGKFSASLFDKVINGYSRPGIKFLEGIARAFSLPLSDVIYASSHNSPPPGQSSDIPNRARDIINEYKHPETKARALEYLEFLRLQEERGQYDTPTEPKRQESLPKALGA